MKKNRNALILLGLVVPMLVACGGSGGDSGTLSGETKDVNFVGNSYLVNARFPYNNESTIGNEEEAYGVAWTDTGWDFQDDITDEYSSFARMVINAPFTGTYPIKLNAKHFDQSYKMRLYVNTINLEYKQDFTVTNTESWSDEIKSASVDISLNKGNNVVFVQVINWGAMSSITVPVECNIVKPASTVSGEYRSNDFIYQATRITNKDKLVIPDATMQYEALSHNINPDYEPAAILHFEPANTTKSLDVTVKVTEKNNNSAGLTVRAGMNPNGDNSWNYDLSAVSLNTETIVHVPSYFLDAAGFVVGSKNNVRFSSAEGKIEVVKVKESTQSDTADYQVINANKIKQLTIVRGRNIDNSSYVGLDYTASGIEFDITGGGKVTANMEVCPNVFNVKASGASPTHIAVEIDGVFQQYVSPSSNTILANNLSASKHNIRIYKTSEALNDVINLTSLKIDNNATISKPTKAYKFEILGDSITCANQVDPVTGYENGYLSYAVELSRSYNADFNIVSASGRGLKVGYNVEEGWAGSWLNQIKDMWDYSSYARDKGESKWNKNSYVPDVVICNLGNNDLGDFFINTQTITIKMFTDEVKSFSTKLRGAYPNAKIIWTYGAFVNRNFESEYRAAVASLNDSNTAFVYLDEKGGGMDHHPNEAQHKEIADALSAQIASMLSVSDPRG